MKRTIEINENIDVHIDGEYVGSLIGNIKEHFFRKGDGFYEVDIEESKRGRYKVTNDGDGDYSVRSPWGWSYYGFVCSESFSTVFFPLKDGKRYNVKINRIIPDDRK